MVRLSLVFVFGSIVTAYAPANVRAATISVNQPAEGATLTGQGGVLAISGV